MFRLRFRVQGFFLVQGQFRGSGFRGFWVLGGVLVSGYSFLISGTLGDFGCMFDSDCSQDLFSSSRAVSRSTFFDQSLDNLPLPATINNPRGARSATLFQAAENTRYPRQENNKLCAYPNDNPKV